MADLSDERAFYYVDGIPTKGKWFDLDLIGDTDDIIAELASDEICSEDYDGDLLVADVEGVIAPHFLSRHGTFDLEDWQEIRDEAPRHVDAEAISAYLDYAGIWSKRDFEEAYWGPADSEEKFAEEYADECMEIPEHLEGYIDYERLARDLFINDFYFNDGYVFRRN